MIGKYLQFRHLGKPSEDMMPALVAIHRLKDFDEWMKVFKSNPPPQIGRWRLLRGTDDATEFTLLQKCRKRK